MTKTKALRALVPNSNVEMMCMAMFRAGVTETSYPQHPGMTSTELAKLAQLPTKVASRTLSWMARYARAVVTTPHKQMNRQYVLSAAQVLQCAEVLRALQCAEALRVQQTSQFIQPEQPVQPTAQLIQREVLKVLHAGGQLTSGQIKTMLREHGFRSNAVYRQLWYMHLGGMIQRSGPSGSYVYSLPAQPAEHTKPAEDTEHTEPAETAEPSNSDHTDPSIVQATIDAFHQAGEPLSDEQIEALHHMHPDRHRVLCERVQAKALAKVRQEREAREARETALFEEYLQAAVEAEQMDLLDP